MKADDSAHRHFVSEIRRPDRDMPNDDRQRGSSSFQSANVIDTARPVVDDPQAGVAVEAGDAAQPARRAQRAPGPGQRL